MPDTREMRKIMELQNLAGMSAFRKRTIAEELERSKLVELISTAPFNPCFDIVVQIGERFKPAFCEMIADHLIANGITVGKPLTEYLHPVDNYAGLKGKYLVFKADTGERVEDSFVLRPAKDHAAVEALRAYAYVTDNKTLSNDIYNWVGDGGTVQKWIPVTERLPEEHDSIFAKMYGTKKWMPAMFRKISNTVIACIESTDGKRKTVATYTKDGEWEKSARYLRGDKVTHWMPLPNPPKEGF